MSSEFVERQCVRLFLENPDYQFYCRECGREGKGGTWTLSYETPKCPNPNCEEEIDISCISFSGKE